MLKVLKVHLLRLSACQDRIALFVLAVDLQQELQAFGIILCEEAAEDLYDIAHMRLHIALGDVAFLQQIEVRMVFAACSFDLLFQFIRFLDRFLEFLAILLFVHDRIANIGGRQFVKRNAVIQCAARGLRIQLQENTAQRGFAAAGFADDTERFALVNVDRDVLVRTNVKTLLLEDGGLRNREVLLQISD